MGAATRAPLRAGLPSERLLVNTACVDLPVCPTCSLQPRTRERSKRNSLCFPLLTSKNSWTQRPSGAVRVGGDEAAVPFVGVCLDDVWSLVTGAQQSCATTLRRVCRVSVSVFSAVNEINCQIL